MNAIFSAHIKSRMEMAERTSRGFVKKDQALKKLERGRAGAIQVCTEAKTHSDEYRAAQKVTESIDDLVDALTGDRTLFHDRGSSQRSGM